MLAYFSSEDTGNDSNQRSGDARPQILAGIDLWNKRNLQKPVTLTTGPFSCSKCVFWTLCGTKKKIPTTALKHCVVSVLTSRAS